MSTDSVPTFLQVVRRSGLLGSAHLDELKAILATGVRNPVQVGRCLVERGILTDFQVRQLLEGHDRDLAFGRYRVLDLLGEGGLCQVFRARDADSGRVVALKVLHPELRENAEVLDQFRQEMLLLTRLDHPNYPKAYPNEPGDPPHFFAMEFINGVDLHKLLQGAGRLPAPQACDYVRQAALGLQHAYELGLVHRDVKPANLLVPAEGNRVRILDIGLARLEWARKDDKATFSSTATKGTSLMGTPDYIAPEQALNPHEADIRADIYSLGCTLFHLLTGQPPFPGASLAKKLLQHQQTPPPSVRQSCPEMPQELALLVQKMMAKRPADRHHTPAGVAVALMPFCQGGAPWLEVTDSRGRTEGPPAAKATPRAPARPEQRPAPKAIVVGPKPSLAPAAGPAAYSGPERRGEPRRGGNPVPVLVSDAAAAAEPMRGWVVNRSPGGLALLAEASLEPDTVASVRPDLPHVASRWFQARVVYCFAERGSWRVGFQFVQRLSWTELRAFG